MYRSAYQPNVKVQSTIIFSYVICKCSSFLAYCYIAVDCLQTLEIENGWVDYSGNDAIYTCDRGFIPEGETVRHCRHIKAKEVYSFSERKKKVVRPARNVWSGIPPVCRCKQKN